MSTLQSILGDKRIIIIAFIGAALAVTLYLASQQIFAGIVIIIFGTLVLSLAISVDVAKNRRPIIYADFSENHREIIVGNSGTGTAEKVEVSVAGIENSWKIDILEPDRAISLSLPSMISTLTAEVTYQVQDNARKSRVFNLGSPEKEYDPFKPLFPIFNWKEKK
ncbi:MAG: hypothetical protein GXY48_02215 [Methanomicrobiales archaeon]|nr:hypothetical protein [Methanomicrobiales archaeon]